ncbi:MAG: DUF4145 domain-containing protein [Planctomycetes bacterium]|nr:DUF4145 domain-containing protein [Planctomycetota bacterium]
MKYIEPIYDAQSFTCPHCHTTAKFQWPPITRALWGANDSDGLDFRDHFVGVCSHCDKWTIWSVEGGKGHHLVFPPHLAAPEAHAEMPPDVQKIYDEARAIAGESPRAASALLRLAVELMLTHLKAEGRDLNERVGWLVAQGAPKNIQQALDAVRFCGNDAVHPLQIVPGDTEETSAILFEIVNQVCQSLIQGNRRISELYGKLPAKVREGVAQRDKPRSKT